MLIMPSWLLGGYRQLFNIEREEKRDIINRHWRRLNCSESDPVTSGLVLGIMGMIQTSAGKYLSTLVASLLPSHYSNQC